MADPQEVRLIGGRLGELHRPLVWPCDCGCRGTVCEHCFHLSSDHLVCQWPCQTAVVVRDPGEVFNEANPSMGESIDWPVLVANLKGQIEGKDQEIRATRRERNQARNLAAGALFCLAPILTTEGADHDAAIETARLWREQELGTAPVVADPGTEAKPGTTLHTDHPADTIKMLRETLCVAQGRVGNSPLDEGRKDEHIARLGRLIADCDRQRPLGSDGKHGTWLAQQKPPTSPAPVTMRAGDLTVEQIGREIEFAHVIGDMDSATVLRGLLAAVDHFTKAESMITLAYSANPCHELQVAVEFDTEVTLLPEGGAE